MPKLRSAKKQLRQSLKRHTRKRKNKEIYREIKRQIKKALEGSTAPEKLSQLVNQFYQAVDKAARTGGIHKNKASREKSRLLAFIKRKGKTTEEEKRAIKPKRTVKTKARKGEKKRVSPRKV